MYLVTCETEMELDSKESNGHPNKIEAEMAAVLYGAIESSFL